MTVLHVSTSSVVIEYACVIPHLPICSDWLILMQISRVLYRLQLQTWYVGSGGQKYLLPTRSVVTEWAYLIRHLHICSDWLIIEKANIQNSVWATVTSLGIWVVVGRKYYPCGLSSSNTHIWFMYLIYISVLIDKKKANIQQSSV